jgi:hypothetical protein
VIAAISTRAGALVAVLVAAALLLALALSPPANARAHSAACTHSADRSMHSASCSTDAGRGHHKVRGRKHSKSGARRHTTGSHTPSDGGGRPEGEQPENERSEGEQSGHGQSTGTAGGGQAGPSGTAQARCEDASAPEAVEGGENGDEEGFVCDDGSEPSCAGGLVPVVSSDGLQLLCRAAPEESHTH